ncbi:LysR family transcriptional regulator [Vibrio splendidus]|uniref:LysR family transcriptional regulator n=1 Tax=Vibrio splendidus TaxID=29497 RepID=UPI00352DD2FC
MKSSYNNLLNLNYLRVFEAVYTYRNTLKAAEYLGISQSAVSQTLSKIREYTGDKLFYSSGSKLHATQKADVIGESLQQQIKFLDEKLSNNIFTDPKTFDGEITVAVSSVLLEAIANELTSSIMLNHFPKLRLNITIWDDDTQQDILDERVQLGVNFHPTDTSKAIRAVPLTPSQPVIISRLDHPICQTNCSLEMFKSYPCGGMFVPGLPDYGAKLKKNYPDIFDFQYRSASMSVLTNLVEHSDLLVIAENLSSSMAKHRVAFHQPSWLKDYIPNSRSHAVYYLEKNHRTSFYEHCIEAISMALRNQHGVTQSA